MFDLLPMLLSSVASFLFPIFASYKALKTSDPAQLTPWLMYWVVFSCCLLVESWVSFILTWVPFYGYVRLLFLLYLILPQTQGARLIYEDHIHPFLEDNELHIDEFIASAHDRLKRAGISYIKQAVEYIKTNALGLPPSEPEPPTPDPAAGAQGYTQSLFARFSVPTTRWSTAGVTSAATTGTDFYSLLANAVSAATSPRSTGPGGSSTLGGALGRAAGGGGGGGGRGSSSLIPSNLRDNEKMSFIAAQRERLNIILSALDREAQHIQQDEAYNSSTRSSPRMPFMAYDGGGASTSSTGRAYSRTRGEEYDTDDQEATQRPPSRLSAWSGISKSRSETDFEKIEVEVEESEDEDGTVRRRRRDPAEARRSTGGRASGSWMPWGWGGAGDEPGEEYGYERGSRYEGSAREGSRY